LALCYTGTTHVETLTERADGAVRLRNYIRDARGSNLGLDTEQTDRVLL
jgi:hypothetical protein